ncbi:MAG: hydrogenase iron-sulfur subunit [Candidatus Bathyarchaeota archaeon]|nr:MAG: hydrogenase iron-sulfur subunit [Candidatus Bathyarchaeota archaeon]
MKFEPKILGFLCNWCSYAGADLAGVSRIQYPPNLRVIRVMCSGRIDPVLVLDALASGLDGVIVMGCHPGDCHYMTGNYEAERKIKMLKKLITPLGFAERLHLEWVSASEGARFAEVVRDFTNHIKVLGPSPLREEKLDSKKMEDIQAAKKVVEDFRLRALVAKERKIIEEGNVYGEEKSQEEFDNIMDDALSAEYIRNRIYLLLEKEPTSTKHLSNYLGLDNKEILEHIVILRRRGLIAVDRVDDMTPIYTVLKR